uniref:Uncharacterized protein n=1 Tax=Aegilops tauschii subsp. strangulata TaxID=200361 RepID=A0A453F2S0_AEGTS
KKSPSHLLRDFPKSLSPMDRFRPLRRIQVEPERAAPPPAPPAVAIGEAAAVPAAGMLMGAKVRRRAAVYRDCMGDYIGVHNDPCLAKILSKQGAVPLFLHH